jgi:hypothetical protein
MAHSYARGEQQHLRASPQSRWVGVGLGYNVCKGMFCTYQKLARCLSVKAACRQVSFWLQLPKGHSYEGGAATRKGIPLVEVSKACPFTPCLSGATTLHTWHTYTRMQRAATLTAAVHLDL